MSLTSGFFNSIGGDRKYNAEQMSDLFNGIINDGVFANIGTAMGVKAVNGFNLTVGIGRAWFDSTWINNDSLFSLTAEPAEVVTNRYDAVIIETDHNDSVRAATIKIIKGTPSSAPVRPEPSNTAKTGQHILCYIYRKAGSTSITQADIENCIGSSRCPYITAILQVTNTDNITAQWTGQMDNFFADVQARFDEYDDVIGEYEAQQKTDFQTWFDDLKVVLSGDVATNLAEEISELKGVIEFDALASKWNGTEAPFTQRVTVTGITATDRPVFGYKLPSGCTGTQEKLIKRSFDFISYLDTEDGSVLLTALSRKPEVDITIMLKGV